MTHGPFISISYPLSFIISAVSLSPLEGPFAQRMVLELTSIQRHKKVLQTLIGYILPHTGGMCCNTAFSQTTKRAYKRNVGAAALIFGYRCEIITAKAETNQMEMFSENIAGTT